VSKLTKFVLQRFLSLIPILFAVSLFSFLLMRLVPGDTAVALLGPRATPEALQMLREHLGLNLPIHLQYLRWLNLYLHGDLGTCIMYGCPVSQVLVERLFNSAILTIASLAMAVVIGGGVAMIAGAKRFSVFDRVSTLTALFLISAPTFWLGLMLMYIFSLKLRWLPAQGMYSVGRAGGGIADLLRHLVLPAIAAGVNSLATIFRLTRSQTYGVMGQGFIVASRSRGLSERSILFRHALRNMLPAVVNVSAMQIGYIFSGALFAEVVFNWPGVGLLVYNSILARDYAVIQAVLLIVGSVFVFANMLADFIHAIVDPRTIRGRYGS